MKVTTLATVCDGETIRKVEPQPWQVPMGSITEPVLTLCGFRPGLPRFLMFSTGVKQWLTPRTCADIHDGPEHALQPKYRTFCLQGALNNIAASRPLMSSVLGPL
jgi:hypothetical protein